MEDGWDSKDVRCHGYRIEESGAGRNEPQIPVKPIRVQGWFRIPELPAKSLVRLTQFGEAIAGIDVKPSRNAMSTIL